MKAKRILISILTVAALLLLVSCSPRVMDELIHSGVSYKVIFDPGDGTWPVGSRPADLKYDEQSNIYYKVVGYNSVVSKPTSQPQPPQDEQFRYWTLDGNQFSFNIAIKSNITLVAYYE